MIVLKTSAFSSESSYIYDSCIFPKKELEMHHETRIGSANLNFQPNPLFRIDNTLHSWKCKSTRWNKEVCKQPWDGYLFDICYSYEEAFLEKRYKYNIYKILLWGNTRNWAILLDIRYFHFKRIIFRNHVSDSLNL